MARTPQVAICGTWWSPCSWACTDTVAWLWWQSLYIVSEVITRKTKHQLQTLPTKIYMFTLTLSPFFKVSIQNVLVFLCLTNKTNKIFIHDMTHIDINETNKILTNPGIKFACNHGNYRFRWCQGLTWFLSRSWSMSSFSPCSWKVMMIKATKMLMKKKGKTTK